MLAARPLDPDSIIVPLEQAWNGAVELPSDWEQRFWYEGRPDDAEARVFVELPWPMARDGECQWCAHPFPCRCEPGPCRCTCGGCRV